MPDSWSPDTGTTHTDYSYNDILQAAQRTGIVGDGNDPRLNPAFNHGPYYHAPGHISVYNTDGQPEQANPLNWVADHNLVGTNNPDNRQVVVDVAREIYR